MGVEDLGGRGGASAGLLGLERITDTCEGDAKGVTGSPGSTFR